MRNIYILPAMMLTGVALAACSMQPEKNAALDDARSGYSAAQSDPSVNNLAAIELQQASKALDQANAAQKQREDREVIDHLAYLAKQRVAIAQETAKLKAAEMAVSDAGAARDKIRLDMRTAEADAATQDLATARETAKQQAAASQAAANRAAASLAAANAETERGQARIDAQTADAEAAKQQATMAQEKANQTAADDLATANAKVAQMATELAALNAKKTERGMVITLGAVLFDTNKADLRSRGAASMQKLADFFKEYPERTALIEGFTDSTGDSGYNRDLSDRRANAVRNTVIGLGVDGNRVSTRGLGEEDPVASNETTAGRQLNRRVEIILSDADGNIAPR
jgi:outer membrane protein OmpA-like peptidoglycan-associated protein